MTISFQQEINGHIGVFQQLPNLEPQILHCVSLLTKALATGHKLLICGNGGSAADAQHFAAELTGHFEKERGPLPTIALTTDTSALTAIGNDYAFDQVFARQVQALGQPGDVLIAISTSGNSANCLAAIAMAEKKGMNVIMLTGGKKGKMSELSGEAVFCLNVPSLVTSQIQEAHIFILHYFCRCIDEEC